MEATEEIERIREAIKELEKIDEKRKDIISKWNEKNIKDTHQYKLEPTSQVEILEQAGKVLYKELLDKFELDNSNILEIMSGNGVASDSLFSGINANYKKFTADYVGYDSRHNPIKKPGEKGYNIKTWIMTDIVDYIEKDRKFNKTSVTEEIFEKLNTVDAVKKYGETSNILLLICPNPTCEFADYFAIKDFIEQTRERKEEKYIVLFGNFEESGGIRMDGSEYLKWYLKKCCRFEFGLLTKIHSSKWWDDLEHHHFDAKRRLEIYKINKPKVKTSDGKSKSSKKKRKSKSSNNKKKRKSK